MTPVGSSVRVRFPATKLKRTIVATGAEGELDRNPLVVSLVGDGRIQAAFEGEDGFTLTLAPKKDESPAPAPSPTAPSSPLDKIAGSWGGAMGGVDIGSGVLLDVMFLDVSRSQNGTWCVTVKMNLTAPVGGGTKIVIDAAYRSGRVQGDSIRFDKVPWHRTVPASGQKDDLDGNPLVVSLTREGKLTGLFEGEDGMSFTLARRAK